MTTQRHDIDAIADEVLTALETGSYEQVAARYGTSRGKIYSLAIGASRRKNEARLQERARERTRRQREYLQEIINSSMTADVLDYLHGVPDNSADLYVTSIPYNIGRRYGDADLVDSKRFHFYLGWILMILSEMERTLAPGGVMFLQLGNTRDHHGDLYPLDNLLDGHLRSMGLKFQDRVIWVVPHGLTPSRKLAGRYETAMVMSKGQIKTFNANAARIPQKQPNKRAFKGPNKGRLSGHPLGAWPTNVWFLNNSGHNHDPGLEHPAVFPIMLAKRAILLYSRVGDLVIDPFCGRGTVLEAAKQTGRNFSGADLFYADMRAQRLAAVVPDMKCDLPGMTDESVAVWAAEARPVHCSSTPISLEENDRQLKESDQWMMESLSLFPEYQ